MKASLQLLLVAILIIPSFSFGQCNGTLSMSVSPSYTICSGDSDTITVSLSNGGAGWSFKIFVDDTAHKLCDCRIFIGLQEGITTFYATADSSGCLQKKRFDNNKCVSPSTTSFYYLC